MRPDRRQFPQAGEHSMLCFLHVHRRVLQSAMQLHLITRSRFSGAGAWSVCSGTKPMPLCRAKSTSRSLPFLDLHGDCGTLLLLMLVVALVDEHETCSKRPSHRTAVAEGSPGCQSSFHCIVLPMLSLLHMSHRAWKLNAFAVLLPIDEMSC